jgi:hypothetical protein
MKELRRLSIKVLTRLVLNCALLLGAHAPGAAQTAPAGHEFELKAGQVVPFDGGRLRVRFVSVAADSRCPEDVDCVWAGDAEVVFEAGGKGWRGKRTLSLHTSPRGQEVSEARYGRYTLRLTALAPRTRSDRRVAPGEYTATVQVTKQ